MNPAVEGVFRLANERRNDAVAHLDDGVGDGKIVIVRFAGADKPVGEEGRGGEEADGQQGRRDDYFRVS